jgi:hypothetical protein
LVVALRLPWPAEDTFMFVHRDGNNLGIRARAPSLWRCALAETVYSLAAAMRITGDVGDYLALRISFGIRLESMPTAHHRRFK